MGHHRHPTERERAGSPAVKTTRTGRSAATELVCTLGLCVIQVASVLGCGQGGEPDEHARAGAEARELSNLVLISLDTLRADRLGVYGYERDTSPQIDGLAARGVRFARATSVAAWTLPAHMTFFTGLYPSGHATTRFETRLPEDVPTLTEVLRKAGYRTFGHTSGGFLAGRYGFERGFEEYGDELLGIRGLLSRARASIESIKDDAPFFLFVQTFSIHCPYPAPEGLIDAFRTTGPEDEIAPREVCLDHGDRPALTDGQRRYLSDRYDASIRATDEQVGRFVRWLELTGRLDDTVLVLISDHGEEFWDHGAFAHSHSLYEELLHVPLIVLAPGLLPAVVDERVSVVDLMPTLLELVGLPEEASRSETHGRSLVGLMQRVPGAEAEFAARPLIAESEATGDDRFVGIIYAGWKLVIDLGTGETMLFDLTADPLEQRDLAASEPERLRALRQRLAEVRTRLGDRDPVHVAPPSEAQLEDLRALGYID